MPPPSRPLRPNREVTRLAGFSGAVFGNGPLASGMAGMAYATIGPFQALYYRLSTKWRRGVTGR